MKKPCSLLAVLVGVLMLAAPVDLAHAQADPSGLWTDVDAASIGTPPQFDPLPAQFRTLRLDQQALLDLLALAPLERTPAAENANVVLYLPLPDGAFGRFRIVASPVMASALAAKFPAITTYAGQGLDDPTATVRLDWTPHGFHALVLSARGAVYVDPYSRGEKDYYLSYFKRDARRTGDVPFNNPDVIDEDGMGEEIAALAARGVVPSGSELRTYRLAVAATGEYTTFHGGTVPDGMAAIVTAMNRVNGVYVRDMAVFMQLVGNNDLVVYTNPATDPYTNSNGVTMLGQNQANLDAVIGDANYDVGHVFSTGGGGVASLGVPCRSGLKARGVTGLSSPIGDPFYIDYVAHEMGHQYGANHTFNGNAGSCAGGNRNASTAYEPGSGTTIMAYAGICGSQNIQPNSDDHFHTASFDEIVAYTTAGAGNGCPVITATGNDAPVPDAGVGGFTIPISTPFSLIGSATDPNGDPLTYNWEEFDLGPAGHPNSPVGNAPLFRSFSSQAVPDRIFPQVTDLVNNTQTIGEILPSYARSLTFRLTVRDNQAGVDHDQIAFSVTDQAGPFLVTGPNTLVTWSVGSSETVTWNVANTNNAPVNSNTVNLLLSTDGGFTYPHTLASGVPNDGAETITVPNTPTTTARVKVEAADNVFFDISNVDFTIQGEGPPLTITLKRLIRTANGTKKVKIQWDENAVTTNKVDFYVDEAPDGTYLKRTPNLGPSPGIHKLKLKTPLFPGDGPFAIQMCEKNSTTVCSNTLMADFTGVPIDFSEPEDDDETAASKNAELPDAFALRGNYPNPFNPVTSITFDLPETAEVSIVVVDMLGRTVMTMPVQRVAAGFNRSVSVDASSLASGTYVYRLTARMEGAVQVSTGRMVLLK